MRKAIIYIVFFLLFIFVVFRYCFIDTYEVKFYNTDHKEIEFTFNVNHIHDHLLDNGLYYKIQKKRQIITPLNIMDNYYLTKKISSYKWSKNLPSSYVEQYLSPMRVSLERFDNSKSYFYQKFHHNLDSLNQLSNISRIDVANFILKDLSTWFIYDEEIIFTRYPNLHSLLQSKRGDCYTISYLNVMALRAAGIPAAVDFCPFWAGKAGGHTEFVVLNDKEVFESNVNTLHKFGLKGAPKVYRLIADVNRNLLVFKNKEIHKDLSFLEDFCYDDVTDQHTKVENIELKNISSHHLNKILYACVISNNEWHPVAALVVNSKNVVFKNLGNGVQYKFAFFENDKFEFIK